MLGQQNVYFLGQHALFQNGWCFLENESLLPILASFQKKKNFYCSCQVLHTKWNSLFLCIWCLPVWDVFLMLIPIVSLKKRKTPSTHLNLFLEVSESNDQTLWKKVKVGVVWQSGKKKLFSNKQKHRKKWYFLKNSEGRRTRCDGVWGQHEIGFCYTPPPKKSQVSTRVWSSLLFWIDTVVGGSWGVLLWSGVDTAWCLIFVLPLIPTPDLRTPLDTDTSWSQCFDSDSATIPVVEKERVFCNRGRHHSSWRPRFSLPLDKTPFFPNFVE